MLSPLNIAGYAINWYWLIVFPTAVLATLYFVFLLVKQQINLTRFQALLTGITIVLSGLLGSKLFSFIEIWLLTNSAPEPSMLGARLYGAILVGMVSCLALHYLFNSDNLLRLLDCLALSSAIGFAIGKIGCFLSGHPGCYGIATTLPWGVNFSYNGQSIGYYAHPVQLYDSIFYVILFTVLLFLFNKKARKAGCIIVLFLMIVSVYSISIELIRDSQLIAGFLSLAQITYVVIFVITLALLILSRARIKNMELRRTQQ